MKGKFITLVLTLGFLAAFGVFMHSPPSILDGLTGATPKAKRAAQMAAPLEGNYLFCINPALEPFSDADFRNDLKAFVSGETEVLSDAGLPHMTLSVCETDYPLLCYATALCERLTAARQQPEIYREMLMNVFLFFPLGLTLSNALPRKWHRWLRIILTTLIGCALSAGIEYAQYRYALGLAETDDVICNTLGAFLGAASLLAAHAIEKSEKGFGIRT